MANSKINSFWLESILTELTPKKEEIEEYKKTESELNNILAIKARMRR